MAQPPRKALTITAYSIATYTGMVTDKGRSDPYVEALRRAVRPGCVVLDIGTGTGVFAVLASAFGARRVYAVEPDDAIQVAREIARANRLAERIEFIQDLSTSITLPEPADVIISDLRGTLPFLQQHIPSIVDARRRHLAPGGVLIAQRDHLWASVVEAAGLYRAHALAPDESAYGLDLRPARRITTNAWCRAWVKHGQLLTAPVRWATLDYGTIDSPDVSATFSFTVARPGTGHGLFLWFDTELAEGIGFSNAPDQPELIYGRAFFPWSEPVPLAAGDVAELSLAATLVGGTYLWRWATTVQAAGSGQPPKARFTQSTFLGTPFSPAQLRKRDASHVPALRGDGEVQRLALDLMDGQRSLREIAETLAERFPARFPDWSEAMALVGPLSQRYSR